MLPRSGNGETFLIKKFLDAQNVLHIFVAIHSLAGAAFNRPKLWELSFPETQDIGGQTAKLGDFSDAEIKFVRDHHIGGLCGFGRGFIVGTLWVSKMAWH